MQKANSLVISKETCSRDWHICFGCLPLLIFNMKLYYCTIHVHCWVVQTLNAQERNVFVTRLHQVRTNRLLMTAWLPPWEGSPPCALILSHCFDSLSYSRMDVTGRIRSTDLPTHLHGNTDWVTWENCAEWWFRREMWTQGSCPDFHSDCTLSLPVHFPHLFKSIMRLHIMSHDNL